LRYEELADAERPEPFFVPLAQNPQPFIALLARTRGNPLAISLDVQRAVAQVDADLPVFQMLSLRGAIQQDTWFFGVFGGLFTVFGVAALILSAVGLYAVMAFSVSQRRARSAFAWHSVRPRARCSA
jgi:putative ABC transport system permease protein